MTGGREEHVDLLIRLSAEGAVKRAAMASPDLLKPKYRELVKRGANPLTGHCYVASEVLRYMLGDDWKVRRIDGFPDEGATHWYLQKGSMVLDPTEEQFSVPVPYSRGKGAAFLTRVPSKRAVVMMSRIVKHGNKLTPEHKPDPRYWTSSEGRRSL